MKPIQMILGAVALAAAAKFTFFPCDGACWLSGGASDDVSAVLEQEPAGDYIEARNVTVFGGACHLNSEYAAQGDAALVAWSFESGRHVGVSLAGVRAFAAVEADSNLNDATPRTSELWIDGPNASARVAAENWIRQHHVDALGDVKSVHFAPIDFERTGDGFALYVDGVVALEGDAIADRACCTMPGQRGYEPLMASAGAVVGNAARCSFEGTPSVAGWEYAGANSVFVTRFGATTPVATQHSCCPSSRAACTPTPDSPKP